MRKHILFVCKSCHHSSEKRPDHQPADGTLMLEQLNALVAEQLQSDEFEIKAVDCLWACDRPCVVAFSAPTKPSYLFTSLPKDETAPALLRFGSLYLNSKTGNIPWKRLPTVLQSAGMAKIPVAD